MCGQIQKRPQRKPWVKRQWKTIFIFGTGSGYRARCWNYAGIMGDNQQVIFVKFGKNKYLEALAYKN